MDARQNFRGLHRVFHPVSALPPHLRDSFCQSTPYDRDAAVGAPATLAPLQAPPKLPSDSSMHNCYQSANAVPPVPQYSPCSLVMAPTGGQRPGCASSASPAADNTHGVAVQKCATRAQPPAGADIKKFIPSLAAVRPHRKAENDVRRVSKHKSYELPRHEINRICNRLESVSQDRKVKNNFVSDAVRDTGPAVVRIDTRKNVTRRYANNVFDILFGIESGRPMDQLITGTGSGFCIDVKGLVLTNAHVVDGADEVFVQFQNGKTYSGRVLGSNAELDMAVVQAAIKDERVPAARLGSSSAVLPGDWAIALGSPLGLQQSVTLGVVSSVDRSTSEGGWDWMQQQLLQTDAAINAGNSGGPLLNERGEVVAMVSARALGADGIGFAVPIDLVIADVPRLLKKEKRVQPCVGIKVTTLSPAVHVRKNADTAFGAVVPPCDGALVEATLPGSPAAVAGLRHGDVVTAIDGTPIKSAADVQRRVRRAAPGASLRVDVRRGARGKARCTVVVGVASEVLESASTHAR